MKFWNENFTNSKFPRSSKFVNEHMAHPVSKRNWGRGMITRSKIVAVVHKLWKGALIVSPLLAILPSSSITKECVCVSALGVWITQIGTTLLWWPIKYFGFCPLLRLERTLRRNESSDTRAAWTQECYWCFFQPMITFPLGLIIASNLFIQLYKKWLLTMPQVVVDKGLCRCTGWPRKTAANFEPFACSKARVKSAFTYTASAAPSPMAGVSNKKKKKGRRADRGHY